jgi:hypothetical protein
MIIGNSVVSFTAAPMRHAQPCAQPIKRCHLTLATADTKRGHDGSYLSNNTQWFDGTDQSLRASDSSIRRSHFEPPLPPAQPTFRAADKVYLKPDERKELSRRLREPRDWKRGLPPTLYIYRYGLDDLRLYKALEAAGLAGIVLVTDRIEDANVVLATRRKRTGKDLSLVNAERAARNSRLPFYEVKSISPERVFEIFGPILGLGERLRRRKVSQSFTLLPRAEEDGSQDILDLLNQLTENETRDRYRNLINPDDKFLDDLIREASGEERQLQPTSRRLIRPQVSNRSKKLILNKRKIKKNLLPRLSRGSPGN